MNLLFLIWFLSLLSIFGTLYYLTKTSTFTDIKKYVAYCTYFSLFILILGLHGYWYSYEGPNLLFVVIGLIAFGFGSDFLSKTSLWLPKINTSFSFFPYLGWCLFGLFITHYIILSICLLIVIIKFLYYIYDIAKQQQRKKSQGYQALPITTNTQKKQKQQQRKKAQALQALPVTTNTQKQQQQRRKKAQALQAVTKVQTQRKQQQREIYPLISSVSPTPKTAPTQNLPPPTLANPPLSQNNGGNGNPLRDFRKYWARTTGLHNVF